MKKRIDFVSLITSILIFLVILVTVLLSLDLTGVISLPENISLKTYFPNLVQVVATAEEETIYYPDYYATGTTADNEETEVQGEESNASLGDLVNTDISSNNSNNKETSNVTDNSYFYNQLNDYGKTIYSRLYSNLDKLKTGTATIEFGTTFNELLQSSGGDQTLTDAFQMSINALLLDHPEIFYLDITKIYMYTEVTKSMNTTTYNVSIGPDSNSSYLAEGFYSESDVLTAESQVEYIASNIVSSLSGSTYDKVKQLHDYLIDNTSYDSDSISNLSHGIYGTLVNNLAVCDGYSKAFKYILDLVGISCVQVCGVGQNSSGQVENHAWNDVLINGTWYAVDVTWDDPIIIGGNGKLTSDLKYNNFLKGSNSFYLTHTEDRLYC